MIERNVTYNYKQDHPLPSILENIEKSELIDIAKLWEIILESKLGSKDGPESDFGLVMESTWMVLSRRVSIIMDS